MSWRWGGGGGGGFRPFLNQVNKSEVNKKQACGDLDDT